MTHADGAKVEQSVLVESEVVGDDRRSVCVRAARQQYR